jgi:hypothetical protein
VGGRRSSRAPARSCSGHSPWDGWPSTGEEVILAGMSARTLAVVALLVAAAFALSRALITRDGVGPFEYAVGVVLVVGLLFLALRVVRRPVRRG